MLLGIQEEIKYEEEYCLDAVEIPTLPCVVKGLQLQYGNNEMIRKSKTGRKLNNEMDLAEFIRELMFWKRIDKNEEK